MVKSPLKRRSNKSMIFENFVIFGNLMVFGNFMIFRNFMIFGNSNSQFKEIYNSRDSNNLESHLMISNCFNGKFKKL